MQRFEVTYRLVAENLSKAKELADIITVEQTVEIPRDTVPSGYIEDEILGRVEDIYNETEKTFSLNPFVNIQCSRIYGNFLEIFIKFP